MARVNVVNLNLVQLPKTACLNPSPSFYKQFNGAPMCAQQLLATAVVTRTALGYTLGLLFAMIFMAVLYLLGVKLIAPLSLRSIPEQERVDRMAKFNSTVLCVPASWISQLACALTQAPLHHCPSAQDRSWYFISSIRA